MQGRMHGRDLPVWLRPSGLTVLVLALTLLRLWSGANAHFVEDEAYYRLWGLGPSLGYYDHPPMIGWWIAAGQWLLGDRVLAVRLLVILASALGSLFLWRTADILFGRVAAGWSVLFLNASILVGVGGILATPDAPSVFFWGLALWALAELHVSQKGGWWLAAGFFAGLGLTSKYSVLFLGAGIVLWLLLVPSARKWLLSWRLWAGGVLAIACFAPVLWWNSAHDWVSFYKQFGRAGRGELTAKYVFEFVGAVLGLLNPLIAIPALAGAGLLVRRMLKGDGAAGLIVLTVLPFLGYLVVHSLHARVQGNWPAPLFPAFAIMAGVFMADAVTGNRFWRLLARGGVLLGLVVAVVVQIHAVHALTGRFARKDPTFQLRGWPEIGREVVALARKTNATYIATSGYGLNGQLAYLLKDSSLPVVQLNERIRYVMLPAPDQMLFHGTGLYLSEERRNAADRLLRPKFGKVKQIAVLPRKVDGTVLENLIVYLVSDPAGDPLDPVSTEVEP